MSYILQPTYLIKLLQYIDILPEKITNTQKRGENGDNQLRP